MAARHGNTGDVGGQPSADVAPSCSPDPSQQQRQRPPPIGVVTAALERRRARRELLAILRAGADAGARRRGRARGQRGREQRRVPVIPTLEIGAIEALRSRGVVAGDDVGAAFVRELQRASVYGRRPATRSVKMTDRDLLQIAIAASRDEADEGALDFLAREQPHLQIPKFAAAVMIATRTVMHFSGGCDSRRNGDEDRRTIEQRLWSPGNGWGILNGFLVREDARPFDGDYMRRKFNGATVSNNIAVRTKVKRSNPIFCIVSEKLYKNRYIRSNLWFADEFLQACCDDADVQRLARSIRRTLPKPYWGKTTEGSRRFGVYDFRGLCSSNRDDVEQLVDGVRRARAARRAERGWKPIATRRGTKSDQNQRCLKTPHELKGSALVGPGSSGAPPAIAVEPRSGSDPPVLGQELLGEGRARARPACTEPKPRTPMRLKLEALGEIGRQLLERLDEPDGGALPRR